MVSSEDVLFGVASVLEHFIAQAEACGKLACPSPFDGPLAAPDTSVHAFLEHIMNSGLCSKECFIMSLVYGERILQRRPGFTINKTNIHRFVLTTVLVGSKILDDFYCRNMYYAMAGGLGKAELNALELKLCDWLSFDLNVEPEEFAVYRDSLIRRSASVAAARAAAASANVLVSAAAAAAAAHNAAAAQQFTLGMPPANVVIPQPSSLATMPLPLESFGKPLLAAPWSALLQPPAAAPFMPAIEAIPPVPQQQQHSKQYQHPAFACGYADPLGAARAWFGSGMMAVQPHSAPLAPLMPPQAVSMAAASMWAPQLHV